MASCWADEFRQGYHTASPMHHWAHYIEEEGPHQSQHTTGNSSFQPFGENSADSVEKCNKTSTNESWITVHFQCGIKNKYILLNSCRCTLVHCLHWLRLCLNKSEKYREQQNKQLGFHPKRLQCTEWRWFVVIHQSNKWSIRKILICLIFQIWE